MVNKKYLMRIYILVCFFNQIFNFEIKYNYIFNNFYFQQNEIYRISSLSNGLYFTIYNNFLKLSNIQNNFRLIPIKSQQYYIELRYLSKKLGINDNNKIILYNNKGKINDNKLIWNLIKINKNEFLIQNECSKNYIEVDNFELKCSNNSCLFNKGYNYTIINRNFIFNFLKLGEEQKYKKKHLEIIKKEPIDVVIKYIDLTDKSLNRKGIKHIYKDNDNEELRYSIRSILQYISWVRKIYIIMPNKKVRFFKSIEEINEKIIYINDKDFLGFDSANIFAFTFSLYKLKKYGVSKNFILMEDDFFIGKSLTKSDFFYYEENQKKIFPFILTKNFKEMNITKLLMDYNDLLQIKDSIHPHSIFGWMFSIYNTDKYFAERYKSPIINTGITHNAIAENLDDLEDIYNEIKNYKYINETLFSLERHILTLNQPQFVNLYQLNIKHKKIHSIPYQYIEMESINKNKNKLNFPLFVINTSGNHQPLNRQYKIQKKVMESRYPLKTKISLNFF